MDLIERMPIRLRTEMAGQKMKGLEEIRVRVGRGIEFLYGNGKWESIQRVERNDIEEMLNYLTGYSAYALEEEMRQGFFTVEGGHRVGVAGHTSYEGGESRTGAYIGGISDISGLNIRVAHAHHNCAKGLVSYIRCGSGIYNTLILAPPGAGKTTYLRDCIRLLSYGDKQYGGIKIGVVDERSEIGACYKGVAQNDLGPRTDVMDNCPKTKGMRMMLRSMSPQVIAVDELGGVEDFEAVKEILFSGTRILGTVHGETVSEILEKPCVRELFEMRMLHRVIVLRKGERGRRIEEVYNERMRCIWTNLESL